MLASLIALALVHSDCNTPPGTADMLARGERFVILGELHGSNEAPAALAAIVCEAAPSGPVTVALELLESMQGQLDAFLGAENDTVAVSALAGTSFMDPQVSDGRSSRAMLAMLHSVRRLKMEGRDVTFHAFQPSSEIAPDLSQAYYELEMGRSLARAATTRQGSRIIALVGNIHARKTPLASAPHVGQPAAGHLPAGETLSVYIAQQGGEAWNCTTECGVWPIIARYDPEVRGFVLGAYGDGAYDAVLALGPLTASPPINSGAE